MKKCTNVNQYAGYEAVGAQESLDQEKVLLGPLGVHRYPGIYANNGVEMSSSEKRSESDNSRVSTRNRASTYRTLGVLELDKIEGFHFRLHHRLQS